MKTLRSVKTDLKMIISGYGFWLCILFTTVLCFSAPVYMDYLKQDVYSAFLSLVTFDREFMLTDTSFCFENVILSVSGGWITMFIPIVASFSVIPLICDEHESKFKRYEIFRGSKLSFYFSKFFSAIIAGGIAVAIGVMVFSGMAVILFPGLSDYSQMQSSIFSEGLSYRYVDAAHGFSAIYLKNLAVTFLYGAFWSAPAVFLTSFIRNKYLVLCVPFFFKYAIGAVCLKIQSEAVSSGQMSSEKILHLIGVIYPDSLILVGQSMVDAKEILSFFGLTLLAFLILYLLLQMRRLDAGE